MVGMLQKDRRFNKCHWHNLRNAGASDLSLQLFNTDFATTPGVEGNAGVDGLFGNCPCR